MIYFFFKSGFSVLFYVDDGVLHLLAVAVL